MASENWTILSAVFKWFGNLINPYEECLHSNTGQFNVQFSNDLSKFYTLLKNVLAFKNRAIFPDLEWLVNLDCHCIFTQI